MAFQGFAFLAFGAISLAVSLYYIYSNSGAQEQGYGYGNSKNTNDYDTTGYERFNSWYEPSSSQSTERKRRSNKNKKSGMRKRTNECTICLNRVAGPECTLPCRHQFHFKCIEDWSSRGPIGSRNTCPNCRETYAMG